MAAQKCGSELPKICGASLRCSASPRPAVVAAIGTSGFPGGFVWGTEAATGRCGEAPEGNVGRHRVET